MNTEAETLDREPPLPVESAIEPSDEGNFTFSGTGWGYYKIYMVNTMLTLLTIGVYSAWAKVRTRRYFFGNTRLDGHNFDFDARPTTILISRVAIVLLLLLLSYLDTSFALLIAGIGVLSTLVLLLLPFAVVRGRSFNSRHTLHRSVRFRYKILYQPTIRLYGIYLLLFALAFYLGFFSEGFIHEEQEFPESAFYTFFLVWFFLLPLIMHTSHSIQINQLSFGKLDCHYNASLALYLRKFCYALAAGLGAAAPPLLYFGIHPLGFFFGALVALMYFFSQLVPIYWSSIRLSNGTKLRSSATAFTYFWSISVLNALLVIISLGILYPVTAVRRWRYLAAHTHVDYSPEHAEISRGADEDLTPIAEEFADVSGMDFDFGAI